MIDVNEVVSFMGSAKKVGPAKIRDHFQVSKKEAKLLYDAANMRLKRIDGRLENTKSIDNDELEKNGNKLKVVGYCTKAKALDDLLKEFGVNRDEFIIEKIRFNKYDQSSSFTCGQIRADMRPKVPELCEFPEIKAIRPTYKAPLKAAKRSVKKLKTALIVPDAQIGYNRTDVHESVFDPYHDFRAMDIVHQVAQDIKPDEIIMMGDMLDLPSFGKYQQKAEFYFTTQPALQTLRVFIDDLRAETSKLVYIYGNHEARFRNSMIEAHIEATQLRKVDFKKDAPMTYSLEYYLGLDDIGVEYYTDYPHDEYYVNNHLALSHSHIAKARSMATVSAIIENDPHISRGIGHIHRCEQATKTTYKKGKPVTNMAFSAGTLCRLDRTIPQSGTRQNWQQGFATIQFEEGDGLFNVNLHHIEQGKAIVGNKVYESRYDAKKMSNRIGYKIAE